MVLVACAADAVDDYDEETDEREDERDIDGGEVSDSTAVYDACLNRGEDRAAEDGHDKAGSTKLGIIAQTVEGNTVDCREHERHACRYGNQSAYR